MKKNRYKQFSKRSYSEFAMTQKIAYNNDKIAATINDNYNSISKNTKQTLNMTNWKRNEKKNNLIQTNSKFQGKRDYMKNRNLTNLNQFSEFNEYFNPNSLGISSYKINNYSKSKTKSNFNIRKSNDYREEQMQISKFQEKPIFLSKNQRNHIGINSNQKNQIFEINMRNNNNLRHKNSLLSKSEENISSLIKTYKAQYSITRKLLKLKCPQDLDSSSIRFILKKEETKLSN